MAWTDISFPSDLPSGWEFVNGSGQTLQTVDQHVRAVYIDPNNNKDLIESYLLLTGLDLSTNGGFTLYSGSPVNFNDWVEAAAGTSTISQEAAYDGKSYCVFTIDGSNNAASVLQTVSGASNLHHYIFKLMASVDNAGSNGSRPTLALECPTSRGGTNSDVAISLTTTSLSQYIGSCFARSGGSFKLKTADNCSGRTIKITDVEIYETSPIGMYLQDNNDRVYLQTVNGIFDTGDFYQIDWTVIPRYEDDTLSQEYFFSSVDFYNGRSPDGEVLSVDEIRKPGSYSGIFRASSSPLGLNGKTKFVISDVSDQTNGHCSLGGISIKRVLHPSYSFDTNTQNPNNVREARRGLQKLGEYEIPHGGSSPQIAWTQDSSIFTSPQLGIGTSSDFKFYVGKHTPGGKERIETLTADVVDIPISGKVGDGKLKGRISEIAVLPRNYMTLDDAAEVLISPQRAQWVPLYGASLDGEQVNLLFNGNFEDTYIAQTSSVQKGVWSSPAANYAYVTVSADAFTDVSNIQPIHGINSLRISYVGGSIGYVDQKISILPKTAYRMSGLVRPAERVEYEFLKSYPIISASLIAENVTGSSLYYDFDLLTWSGTFKYTTSSYADDWRKIERLIVNPIERDIQANLYISITTSYHYEGMTSVLVDDLKIEPVSEKGGIIRNGLFSGGTNKTEFITNDGLDSATSWSSTAAAPSSISFAAGLESNCAKFGISSSDQSVITLSQQGAMDFTQKYILTCYAKVESDGGYSSYSLMIDGQNPDNGLTVSHLLGPLNNDWRKLSTIIYGNPFGPENVAGSAYDGTGRLVFRSGRNCNNKFVYIDELSFSRLGTAFSPSNWTIRGLAENRNIYSPTLKVLNSSFTMSNTYWITSSVSGGDCNIIQALGENEEDVDNYLFKAEITDASPVNYKFQISQDGGMDPYHSYVALITARVNEILDHENPPSIDIVGLEAFGDFANTVSNYITLSEEWKEHRVDFIGYHPGATVYDDIGKFIIRGGANLSTGLEVLIDKIRVYEKEEYVFAKESPPVKGTAHIALPTNETSSITQNVSPGTIVPNQDYSLRFAAYCTSSELPFLPLYVLIHNETKNLSYLTQSSHIGYGGEIRPVSVFDSYSPSTVHVNAGWQRGEVWSRLLIEPKFEDSASFAKYYEIPFSTLPRFGFSDSYKIAFAGYIPENKELFTNNLFTSSATGWTTGSLGSATYTYHTDGGIHNLPILSWDTGASGLGYAQQTVLPGAADSLGTTLFTVIVDASATDATAGTTVAAQDPTISVRAGTALGNTALISVSNSEALAYNNFKRIIFNDIPNSVDGTLRIQTGIDGSEDNIKYHFARAFAFEQRQLLTSSDFEVAALWNLTSSGESTASIGETAGINNSAGFIGTVDKAGNWFQLQRTVSTYSYTASSTYVTSFLAKTEEISEARIAVYGAVTAGSQTETAFVTDTLTTEWKEYMIIHYGQVGTTGLKIRPIGTCSDSIVYIDNMKLFKYPFTNSSTEYNSLIHIDDVSIKHE